MLFYQYVLDGDFPNWLLQDEIDNNGTKDISQIQNKYKNRLTTIRTNKRIYNKMCVYFNEWSRVYTDNHEWLLYACFSIALFEVFNYMNILNLLLDPSKFTRPNSWNYDKLTHEEKEEYNKKNILIERWIQNELRDLMIKNILAGQSIPTQEEISTYYDTANFINYLQELFQLFGYQNHILNTNIQKGILDKYNNDSKKYDFLKSFYKMFENVSVDNRKQILTQEFCDSLLSEITRDDFVKFYESKPDFFGSKSVISFGFSFNENVDSIVFFYIFSSYKEDKKREIVKLIELLLDKSVWEEYGKEFNQKGQFLLSILKLFNNYPKQFNQFKELHKTLKDNIYILITGNSYSFHGNYGGHSYGELYEGQWLKLDLTMRRKIWKLIDTESISKILEYIEQNTEELSRKILLLELYMYTKYHSKDIANTFNILYHINNGEYILCAMLLKQYNDKSNLVLLDDIDNKLKNLEPTDNLTYLLCEIYNKKISFSNNIYNLILRYTIQGILRIYDSHYPDGYHKIETDIYSSIFNSRHRKIIEDLLHDIDNNYNDSKLYLSIYVSDSTSELLDYMREYTKNIRTITKLN